MDFSEALKNFMQKKQLKVKDISQICEKSIQTIYSWTQGRVTPDYTIIKKFFELGMNDEELFGHNSPYYQQALDSLQRATEKIKALESENKRLNKIIDRLLEAARA